MVRTSSSPSGKRQLDQRQQVLLVIPSLEHERRHLFPEGDNNTSNELRTSSSSTPPIPPIPRSIIINRVVDDINRSSNTTTPSNIHPALRSPDEQAIMRERQIKARQEQEQKEDDMVSDVSGTGLAAAAPLSSQPETTSNPAGISARPQFSREGSSSSQHVVPTTAQSFSTAASFHSALPPYTAPSSEDEPEVPLLSDHQWEGQGWDKGSGHGSRSTAGDELR